MAGDLTIDPRAQENYNHWRAKRLAGIVDLSIEAYNEEQLKLVAAWHLGRKAGLAGKPESDCPYQGGDGP